jgi:soluble lytic murein transglycosylase
MTTHYWERTIRVRWSSVILALLAAALSATLFAAAVKHSTTKRKSRAATSAAKKKAVAPAAPKAKAAGAAVLLALAQKQLDGNNLQTAVEYASRAAKEAPELDDYANYVRAEAQSRLRNPSEVTKAVAHVLEHNPVSPITGPAAALAVQADLDNDKPRQALELIRKFYARIPQPQADSLLARAFQATGDLPQAAEYFQRVYYGYPKTKDADDAENCLNDLRTKLGENYPPPMPTVMLGRAMKLVQARDYIGARNELNNVIPQLGGAQRDIARVRLGEVDFFNRDYAKAKSYLESLQVGEAAADAERLDYLGRSVLKIDRQASVDLYLDTLAKKYPQSPFRLDLLLTAANLALFDNDKARYTQLFSACAASYPRDPDAEWCHWRLVFEHYRSGASGVVDELKSFVTRFPSSSDANAALYFIARSAEAHDSFTEARAYYDAIVDHYPNTYYGLQARKRLKTPRVRTAEPAAPDLEFLKTVTWPAQPQSPSFIADRAAAKRLRRSRLLHLALLDDWAELELRFASRNDGSSPYVYAYELAKIAAERNAPDQAIRYVKQFAPGYLQLGFDDAPASFWHFAFPLPYRTALTTYSRQNGLDPYLVAALIRQESEFNVRAISHAKAYGLMQVLPSTGRQLARQLRIRHFSANDLLTPNRNLQLGTMYFRWLMKSLGDQEEQVLAAFNAGKSRVDRWNTWGPFHEQAEFIETIPFQETRNYVEMVLRNADVYRQIYSGEPAPKASEKKPAPVRKHTAPRKTSRRKSAAT